jgi:hypothetical protein
MQRAAYITIAAIFPDIPERDRALSPSPICAKGKDIIVIKESAGFSIMKARIVHMTASIIRKIRRLLRFIDVLLNNYCFSIILNIIIA